MDSLSSDLELEHNELKKELEFMKKSMSKSRACKDLYDFIMTTPEKLENSQEKWHTENACCSIQ
jgi:hypothetical protein